MTKRDVLAAGAAALLIGFGAAAAVAAKDGDKATATIESKSGSKVTGKAEFTEQASGGTKVEVWIENATPGSHGLHLHEKGDCSAADFTSAGAHINHATAKKPHGVLNPAGPDFGDLPNIYVDADGRGKAEAYSTLVKFSDLTDADGSALVIHANPDDHLSQPIGGAGGRVACGVIK